MKYSTPSKNAFLTATNVVFVPYLLWLLWHRRPSRKELIASLLCIVGIALLTLKKDALHAGLRRYAVPCLRLVFRIAYHCAGTLLRPCGYGVHDRFANDDSRRYFTICALTLNSRRPPLTGMRQENGPI